MRPTIEFADERSRSSVPAVFLNRLEGLDVEAPGLTRAHLLFRRGSCDVRVEFGHAKFGVTVPPRLMSVHTIECWLRDLCDHGSGKAASVTLAAAMACGPEQRPAEPLAARVAALEAIIIDVARELSSQASNGHDAAFWADVARRVEESRE